MITLFVSADNKVIYEVKGSRQSILSYSPEYHAWPVLSSTKKSLDEDFLPAAAIKIEECIKLQCG